MSKKMAYPVQVFWSDEDEGYIAIAPDLPGCSAFGETAEEALRESRPAIEAWLEAARLAGNSIPEPSKLPLHRKYSGKVLLRLPQTLHGQLAEAAEREGTSLNQYIVFLLAEGHTSHTMQSFEAAYPVVGCLNFYKWSPFQVGQVRPLSGITVMTSSGGSDLREFDQSVVPQIHPAMQSPPWLLGKGTGVVLSTNFDLQKRSAV